MPKEDDDDGLDQLVLSHSGSPHQHGTVLDPRAAMPGAVKKVGSDKPLVDESGPVGTKAELRRKYFEFVHYLAHPDAEYAHSLPEERLVPALAKCFAISYQEAEKRQVELHDALSDAARTFTFGDALRKKNVDLPARVAMLADSAYSGDKREKLAALKMLNDMDEGATASQEETIEDFIASMLEE